MSRELSISTSVDDGVAIVRLAGTLDLSLGEHRLVPPGATQAIFDFSEVRRVTSFGILMWSRALEGLSLSYMVMSRCRPCIVQQLNVIQGFAGACEVASVYLPYVCEPCDKEFDVLWDLHEKHGAATRREVPTERCPRCGKHAEFDDIPESYLAFAKRVPEPRAPSSVASRLLSLRLNDVSRDAQRMGDEIRDRGHASASGSAASGLSASGRGGRG